MILQKTTIYLFIFSLLVSNLLWAGEGQLDNFFDSRTSQSLASQLDMDNDVLHHLEDEHHDGHDCHMSAHLVGLNSQILTITNIDSEELFSIYNIHFNSHQLAPPSKPPSA